MVFVLRAINDCMIVFFRGQVLVALCVGALLAIGYLILGLNYAVLLGVVAAVLGIVPYLGTSSASLSGAHRRRHSVRRLAASLLSCWASRRGEIPGGPRHLAQDHRRPLRPASFDVILAVMIGANLLGGFLGALLAVPLTAVLRTLMFRYVWKSREAAAGRESKPRPKPVTGKICHRRRCAISRSCAASAHPPLPCPPPGWPASPGPCPRTRGRIAAARRCAARLPEICPARASGSPRPRSSPPRRTNRGCPGAPAPAR